MRGYGYMKIYGIGNALLHYREKKNISQPQVCEGICSEMTISRMETGEREYDALISETLLSRVGKSTNRFEFVLNDEDYYLYRLRETIEENIKNGNLDEAKKNIAEYEEIMPDIHDLHCQFLMYQKALLMQEEGKEQDEIVQCLYHAINLTRSDFKEPTNGIRLYSTIEIKIIYELLQYENYSEEVLHSVIRFVEKMYDEEEKSKILTPFQLYIGRQYRDAENWEKVDQITARAIELLQSGRTYTHLLEFHYMNLEARYHLGYETEPLLRCYEIYYMAQMVEDDGMMQKIQQFCEEQLECQIII